MTTYFTSDLHFGHQNIIRLCNRPFSDFQEMERVLVRNINATVAPNDELFILGDVSMKISRAQALEIIQRIRCKNLYLINGNHDRDYSELGVFKMVRDYMKIERMGHQLILFHYPIMDWAWKERGSIQLHGHIHTQGAAANLQNFAQGLYRYDVGVDANEYRPVSLDSIIQLRDVSVEKVSEK